jgi:hypothetical protein
MIYLCPVFAKDVLMVPFQAFGPHAVEYRSINFPCLNSIFPVNSSHQPKYGQWNYREALTLWD